MSLLYNLSNKPVSNKTARSLDFAGQASEKSTLNFTHGCIITKNGKKVIEGFNHDRSYCNGTIGCSFHAEFHAINRWKSTFLRGKKKQGLL